MITANMTTSRRDISWTDLLHSELAELQGEWELDGSTEQLNVSLRNRAV